MGGWLVGRANLHDGAPTTRDGVGIRREALASRAARRGVRPRNPVGRANFSALLRPRARHQAARCLTDAEADERSIDCSLRSQAPDLHWTSTHENSLGMLPPKDGHALIRF